MALLSGKTPDYAKLANRCVIISWPLVRLLLLGKIVMFDSFFRLLRDIHTSNQNLADAIRAHTQAYERAQDAHQEAPPSPINLPPAIPAYYESEQNERPSKNRWELVGRIIAFVTVIAALAVAIFTYSTLRQVTKQANSAQGQLRVMQRQLRMDQRAWIIVKYPTIQLIDGSPITVPLATENIGNTVAKNVSGKVSVYLTKAGGDPDLDYGPGHTHYEFGPTGLFIPNTPDVMNWDAIRDGKKIILTTAAHRAIIEGDMLITIHGKIEYRDIFGDSHWLTFCQQAGGGTMRPTSSNKCASYNNTDEQEESR